MGVGQGRAGLPPDPGHLVGTPGGPYPGQVAAFQVLHHHERDAVVGPGREHGHDVRMIHPGGQAHLPLEPRHVLRVGKHLGAHHLDRDGPVVKPLVSRQPYLAHAARAKPPDQAIPPPQVSHCPPLHASLPPQAVAGRLCYEPGI